MGYTISEIIANLNTFTYDYVTLDSEMRTLLIDLLKGVISLSELPYVLSNITCIDDYAFRDCINLRLSKLPDTVTRIGDGAFSDSAVEFEELPNGITSIGESAFYNCTNLRLSKLPDSLMSLDYSAFSYTGISITTVPSTVTILYGWTFEGCDNITNFIIPESITYMDYGVFSYCTNLATVVFRGTPTTISDDVFASCTNLTTINVPWAEGAVANAPWGATNATINYNYTG